MKFTVFTGVHIPSSAYLQEAYDSLKAQEGGQDWEWILVPNGGAAIPFEISSDPRVKVHPFLEEVKGVGQIKAFACSKGHGDILVELDADDILTPDALAELALAFGDPAVQFAYSNDVEFQTGTWEPHAYGEDFGWQSRPFEWEGHELIEHIAWEPSAHMLRKVYWAPDHVRAWRATAYAALGGHRPDLAVGDDHELLIRTYLSYGAQGMRHIDKVLYLYRLHEENTVKTRNDEIQQAVQNNYLFYTEKLAVRWARDEGLRRLDIGGALAGASGYETVDIAAGADIQADLNERWPFEDNSVGVLRASHVLEHLRDPIHAMNEAYRVLAPGGFFLIEVPSTDGRGAFQDPTHVSFWNENSFWYYTQAEKAAYIPAFTGRFQKSELMTYYPDQWWKDNAIPVVRADLIALKAPYDERAPGGATI